MSEIEFIVNQLEHAFDGDPWHGPALMNVLSGINVEQAAARPLTRAHSIWELVLHITAWKNAITTRLEGQAIELEGENDWPRPKSDKKEEWNRALSDLRNAHEVLKAEVAQLPAPHLENLVPNRPYTVRFMLYGVIQHEAYHAGQIALLKKDL